MPSYFFHLSLELYPYPEGTATELQSQLDQSYLPSRGANIFKNFCPSRNRISAKSEEGIRLSPTEANNIGDQTSSVGIEAGRERRVSSYQAHADRRRSFPVSLDRRYDSITVESIDMVAAKGDSGSASRAKPTGNISHGIGAGSGGVATRGRYVPSESGAAEVGWGIIHLYRDADETPGLYDDDETFKRSVKAAASSSRSSSSHEVATFKEEDCTTLCVLAVPSYLTPSDFLGFVGEKTREEVTHFRMIKSAKVNRYMVLMKFRSAKRAREWRKGWNGKAFNSMEPENCHVVFIKSVEIRTPKHGAHTSSFPDMANDPFTPSTSATDKPVPASAAASSLTIKPLAPPTPSLIELPTCPVCLERMDESTGLLTILCQHVFHCDCLQKWKGSGCPVCRYTQEDSGRRGLHSGKDPSESVCSVCRSEDNLWICLICGNVGCGRYDGAHAYAHYEQTLHSFAMDLATQRVWDYTGDNYVHRILQDKSSGTSTDLPIHIDGSHNLTSVDDTEDYVPREKLDNIGMEYTHLLTSQLDSQRLYFEEKLEQAADKASVATATAENASASALLATQQLTQLQAAHDALLNEVVPGLERDKARAERRAEKFEMMSRKLEKEWREEKAMNGSLMERVEVMGNELKQLREANADLTEQIRDLSFFISSQEKLKDHSEDVREGTVSVPDPPQPKKKGKGRR